MVLLDEAGRIQHVLVQVGRVLIDGDGLTLEPEFLARWRELEGIKGPHIVPLDAASNAALDTSGIPADPDIQARLVGLFQAWMDAPAFLRAARSR